MQDRIHLTPGTSPSPAMLVEDAASGSKEAATGDALPSASPPAEAKQEASTLDQSLSALGEMLDEHKGKLSIGAAAMLGLMVYYKWGEKSLAKEDPEEYERLRRIKEGVRHADGGRRASDRKEATAEKFPDL